MKYLLLILFVIGSSFTTANESIDQCKKTISIKTPYKINQWFKEPVTTINNQHDIITIWNETYITYSDGKQYPSSIKCVYQESTKKVIFLNIFDSNVISPHEEDIEKLKTASKEEAQHIATSLGIPDKLFPWLKANGKRNFYGIYNPKGKIIGFTEHSKMDLELLNSLYVISLYPEKVESQYSSSATKLSKILSDKL